MDPMERTDPVCFGSSANPPPAGPPPLSGVYRLPFHTISRGVMISMAQPNTKMLILCCADLYSRSLASKMPPKLGQMARLSKTNEQQPHN